MIFKLCEAQTWYKCFAFAKYLLYFSLKNIKAYKHRGESRTLPYLNFPLKIFSINVTKSAENCRLGYIY